MGKPMGCLPDKYIMREQFEDWISSPPFEKNVARYGELEAWPGAYQDYMVHLSWDAWQEATLIAARAP